MRVNLAALALFVFALTAEAVAAPLFAPLATPPAAGKEENAAPSFRLVPYEELNKKQRENHNFHKVAAVLADYGYNSIRLTDDAEKADFLAVHIDGKTILRVQLKGRLEVNKKYMGKDLHIAFPAGAGAYVFPHDEFVKKAGELGKFTHTNSWKKRGITSGPALPSGRLNCSPPTASPPWSNPPRPSPPAPSNSPPSLLKNSRSCGIMQPESGVPAPADFPNQGGANRVPENQVPNR